MVVCPFYRAHLWFVRVLRAAYAFLCLARAADPSGQITCQLKSEMRTFSLPEHLLFGVLRAAYAFLLILQYF
jgi:hypothetical protein